jgi:hypothetical protein
LIDDERNVINKQGKVMFEKDLLDKDGEIPLIFRNG